MRYTLLCSLDRSLLCTKTSSAESSIFQNAMIPYEQYCVQWDYYVNMFKLHEVIIYVSRV